MARIRRTVSLKPEVNEVLEDKRGKKNLSTFMNDHFEGEFPKEVEKKKKELAKNTKVNPPITKG